MDVWWIFLIIFGIVLLLIIIASSRNKNRKKQPKRTIETYLEHGDYISAGRLYLSEKKEQEAADLYFIMPSEKRPLYESMILQQLGSQSAQLFWIKTGRRYELTDPSKAKKAYLLAGAYFDAVKMFVNQNDSVGASEIVKHIPINHQENTVRRLSQYAFDRGKIAVAADLLRSIGLVDEADAILAAGAHQYGTIERPEVAATLYDEVGRQDLAGESQEQRGERALLEGKIQEAKTAFEKAIEAYDDSNQPKEALRVEERLQRFDLLEKFRDYAASGNADAAEDMIDEISKSFPGIAVSDLYAEIASVLEKSNRSSEAITYYDKAADSTNNPVKKQGYVNALRRIGSQIASQTSQGVGIANNRLSDNCSVCKRSIEKGDKYVSCPECGKPAHYAHLVEWVKVQGSCPICLKRLKVDDLFSK
ncbi:MAG: hypothetical protein FK734_01730 [Asgard group archaeon]|nr:hypothetical protein [Asgard group archaeon]